MREKDGDGAQCKKRKGLSIKTRKERINCESPKGTSIFPWRLEKRERKKENLYIGF